MPTAVSVCCEQGCWQVHGEPVSENISRNSIMTTNRDLHAVKTFFSTGLALVVFAANSIFCRMAIGNETLDAASFTEIRLLSGAGVLLMIRHVSSKNTLSSHGSWVSALMLFGYATTFSFAYVTLSAGIGALILFGAVQLTIILAALISGDNPHRLEWFSIAIAFAGFVTLVLPGLTAPSFSGFFLMTTAGISWGIYTLRGRGAVNPLAETTSNFTRSLLLALFLSVLTVQRMQFSVTGVVLAILSGTSSGIGYTIWYRALHGLTRTQSAVCQLIVPVLAAFGGIIFLSESISLRLILATVMILGGVGLVIGGRAKSRQ